MPSLEQRIKNYERLLQANETALQHVATVATIGSTQQNSLQEIDALFRAIHNMKLSIYDMNFPTSPFYEGEKNIYFNRLDSRISGIERQTRRQTYFAVFQKERTAISPSVRKEILQRTQRWIALLNPKLEGDFSPEEAKVDDLHTPHDCIRYMHRVGTELFFDPNGEQWHGIDNVKNFCEIKGGGFTVFIAPTTDSVQDHFLNNSFLQRLHDIMKSEKFRSKYNDNECILALAGERILSFQFPLGCHYATLQIKEEKEQYRMSFKFTDTTTYHSSAFRSDVAEKILQSLGYTVSRNKNVMWFNEAFSSLDAAVNNFEEIIRFSASLYNVDTLHTENIIFRENDIIEAYKAGVINLAGYISNWKRGTYVEFAKACNTYRGQESMEHLEKPIVHETTQDIVQKKPLEYVVDSLKKSYTAVKKFWKETDPYYLNIYANRIEDSITGILIGALICCVYGLGYLIYKDASINNIAPTEKLSSALYAPLAVCPADTADNTIDSITESMIKVNQK